MQQKIGWNLKRMNFKVESFWSLFQMWENILSRLNEHKVLSYCKSWVSEKLHGWKMGGWITTSS
jgi:hypothetical protein